MKKELIVHQDPKSPISEIFRTLRTNIQFMNTKSKLKTILLTSTFPGEGKSWVSSNLAVTFAQANKKVILIDADMRKGRQYQIFGASPKPGLSNYLSGVGITEDAEASEDLSNYIQETEVENLYLIAAGNIPPNPSELLISPQMVNMLEQLKEMFDIVIIDGTPSQLVTDSLILTRLVDSTVVVTASKQTKKEDLRRIINNIESVGGKISGVVVNKLTISAKKYEQSYYYGSKSTKNIKGTPKKSSSNRGGYNRAANILGNKSSSNRPVSKPVNTEKPKLDDIIGTDLPKPDFAGNGNDDLSKPDFLNKENNEDLPKALQSKIEIKENGEVSIEKTNDILKQINEYLDNEKKKLN